MSPEAHLYFVFVAAFIVLCVVVGFIGYVGRAEDAARRERERQEFREDLAAGLRQSRQH